MSPKLFSIAEKEQLKENMFLSGLELLKEYGMTHMSVEKIAASAGIGKSTFYNFFMSKEDFVLQRHERHQDFRRHEKCIQTLSNRPECIHKIRA